MKNVFAKILVLVLCLTFVISGLASCKTDDQIADIQNQLDQNKNDDSATATALEELQTLVKQIESTAKSAATAAALQEVIANLDGVKATADAAATAAKLTEVEEALKALVNSNGEADASMKAELEAAIAAVKVTADAAATKAAFDAAVAELQNAIATEKAGVAAELATIKNSIAAATTQREALDAAIKALESTVATNKTAVDNAIADVNATITANKTALENAIAELTAAAATKTELNKAIADLAAATEADLDDAIKAVEDEIDALEASAATKAALTEAIDGVKKTAADNKTALEASIAALTEAAATKEALKAAIEDVKGLITANGTADAETKADLEALTNIVAANKTAVDNAIAGLTETAATKEALADLAAIVAANKTALETSIATLDTKVEANAKAAAKALDDAKTELEGKITALGITVETLDATVAANKTALENAIADVKVTADAAATKEALDTLSTIVANNKTALEKAIADVKVTADAAATKEALDALSTTVTNNKTDLDDAIAKLQSDSATKSDVEALKTQVTGDITAAVEALKNELEGKITALENKVDAKIAEFTEQIGSLQQKDTELKALVDIIAADVEALKANDFVSKYEAATKELYNGTYSKAAFDTLVASVEKDYYADDDFAKFTETADRLKFFLGRAITVDDIKAYFEELEALIAKMPTLNESLRTLVDAVEVLKNDEDTAAAIAKINGVYDKIVDKKLAVNTETDPTLADDYALVIDAYDNLLGAVAAADAVEEVIAGISTPVIYEDSLAAIENGEKTYADYVAAYFAKENYTAYYELTADVAVENYAKLTGYRARYDQLVAAVAAKDADPALAVIEAALNYNTVRPLYTDYEALNANTLAINAWVVEYAIDADNYAKIYGEEGELLKSAEAYALAMKNVYEKNNVAELCANIDALTAKTPVLYTDTAIANQYANAVIKLENGINKLAKGAKDGNFEAMLGVRAFELKLVMNAQKELANAKAEIDEVNAKMVELLGNVDINSYDTIKGFRAELDEIYKDYGIGRFDLNGEYTADANYEALATVAEANYVELIKQYNDATAVVAAAYLAVRNRLDAVEWLVKDGKEIPVLVADLKNLIKMGVENVNLIFESGDIEVNIPKLYDDYLTAASDYKTLAKEIAEAADPINADIVNVLSTLNPKDVKDKDNIAEIYGAFTAWVEAYLAADVTATGSVANAIAAIQGIAIYGESGNYEFVTVANYDALIAAYTASVETYAKAEAAWAIIKADMVALHAGYDIHSYEESELNFVAVKAAYDAYVNTYYAGTTTYIIDAEEEATVSAFNTDMADCFMALQKAEAAAKVIIDKIDGLADIAMDNADDVLVEIATIEGLIEAYKTAYCDGLCNITEARYFALRKARAVAEVSSAYNVAYTAASADDQAKLMEAYLFFVHDCMKGAANDAELASFRNMAESKLA